MPGLIVKFNTCVYGGENWIVELTYYICSGCWAGVLVRGRLIVDH